MDAQTTETAKPLTAKQQRAAAIKQANADRIARLKAQREAKKQERAAAKASKPPKKPADPAKAAAAAEKKAAREAAAADLKPVAKEVNHRLEQAKSLDGKADDHRLAAALALKGAEERCKASGIDFKSWSVENVKGQSYETVRKLLAVGKSEDPPKALADLRAKNALANKELRERKKAEAQQPTPEAPEAVKALVAEIEQIMSAPLPGPAEKFDGIGTVTARPTEPAMLSGVAALKAAFNTLKASDKMAFTEWAALEIGAKLVTEFDADPAPAEVQEPSEPAAPVPSEPEPKKKAKLVRKK